MTESKIANIFGGKVRVRVMGVLIQNDKILLINHRGMNKQNELWLPPGGGVDFGYGVKDTLEKEFKEELNIEIEVGDFLFWNEFISSDLHGVEMFFEVKSHNGQIKLGFDPELGSSQILQGWAFIDMDQIRAHKDVMACFHPVFRGLTNIPELLEYRGFIEF